MSTGSPHRQGGPAGGALGLAGVSKDQVSRLCQGLDEQVRAFRERPLEVAYPYLWLDAKVERVRPVAGSSIAPWWWLRGGCQRPAGGHRPGCGAAETEAFWREFLRSLVRRGLAGAQLVISDAHEASSRHRPGAGRSLAALYRPLPPDALGHCPKDLQQLVGAAIRPIFRAGSVEEARRLLEETVAHLEARCPRSPGCWRRPSGCHRLPPLVDLGRPSDGLAGEHPGWKARPRTRVRRARRPNGRTRATPASRG
jgi:transposase-like protein